MKNTSSTSNTSATRPDLAALSGWAPELARTFVSLSSDIALVIDDQGVIRSVAQGSGEPMASNAEHWVGRAWIDTVSGETRPKIEHLLQEVAATGIARRREVNHPLAPGSSIPVAYTAIRLGANGPVLAVGRDLRAIAAIQQRFVESQQDIERGYWQARQAESRYQLLFQVATDAVLVVDGQTLQIVEANQAATRLFGATAEQLQGRHFSSGFEHHSRGPVNELLGSARSVGESGEIRARLQGTNISTSVVATPFRADDAMRLLVRLRAIEPAASSSALNRTLSRLVDDTSDGVVVTDSSGRILIANPAFLALVHVASESQVKGQPLMTWLSLANQPLAALVADVRRDGIARRIASWAKRAAAPAVQIEISAALLAEGDQECIGFTIHPISFGGAEREAAPDADGSEGELSRALHLGIESLSAQLGELELSVLVRDAAVLVERHFRQLALRRSGGNAAAASGLLEARALRAAPAIWRDLGASPEPKPGSGGG